MIEPTAKQSYVLVLRDDGSVMPGIAQNESLDDLHRDPVLAVDVHSGVGRTYPRARVFGPIPRPHSTVPG